MILLINNPPTPLNNILVICSQSAGNHFAYNTVE